MVVVVRSDTLERSHHHVVDKTCDRMSREECVGDGSPSREDIAGFLRVMSDHVKSLHDRLDESIHRVKNVPKDELQDFVEKERKLLEEWSRERLEEFSRISKK